MTIYFDDLITLTAEEEALGVVVDAEQASDLTTPLPLLEALAHLTDDAAVLDAVAMNPQCSPELEAWIAHERQVD